MKRLEGKVCIVTGGTSGIGKAICLEFLTEGGFVAVFDVSGENGRKMEEELEKTGKQFQFVKMDVTSEEQWINAVKKVQERYGHVDVLVNCAGIFQGGKTGETDFAVFQKIMDVNVNGVFLGMKAVLPVMCGQKSGNIVNIASEAGISAIPEQVAYNTSKAAVIMLTKSTAVDYAIKKIRVNCICPGRVHTELVQRILDQAEDYDMQYKIMSEDRPMMHMGKPEDIAKGAVYLASDEASYATGTVLSIDGGYVCP